jgi:hypothetical protein
MADARLFQDLKQDHDNHRALLREIAECAPEKREPLFKKLRTEIGGHAAAEEEALYATMLAKPDLRDDAKHSVAEHKEIDDFMGELSDLDTASPEWLEKFGEMRHRYEHHIDEEEEEMFPAAAEGLSEGKVAELARVFENRKPAELANAEANPPGSDERE